MAKKLYDIGIGVSKYTDSNGNEKKIWRNIGAIYINENGGKYLTLDAFFNFASLDRKGADKFICSLFSPKNQQQQQRSSAVGQAQSTQNNDFSDFSNVEDVPF